MFQNLTVLVVDDNDTIRMYMDKALTQLGVGRVITASCMTDVKTKIALDELDGVFLDLVLQYGSGLDLARIFRSHKVPVIFCSGVTDEYNIKQMYELGFVFNKPIHMYMLNRGLRYFKSLKLNKRMSGDDDEDKCDDCTHRLGVIE